MKKDFLEYMQSEFDFTENEMQEFADALDKPLKKTLRINTNRISVEDFLARAKKKGRTLSETELGNNIFYIDRETRKVALGNTQQHLCGYFYVQELAASSSPYYMSGDTINTDKLTILDMSASPGGKTTQLSEYYPNSQIIANEIDKARLMALYLNLDRMMAYNVAVTNYDGRFFKNIPKTFDKILLDAPCSGEGTAYKNDDALKFWNIKNVRRIAKLQFGLIEAALISAKVGGEITYSTCTLNKLENEHIIEKMLKKYPDCIEIIPLGEGSDYIRSWPHKKGTGGFFVAKIRKTASLPFSSREQPPVRQNIEKLSSKETRNISDFFEEIGNTSITNYHLYRFKSNIFASKYDLAELGEKLFLFQPGTCIGTMDKGIFTPKFLPFSLNKNIQLKSEELLRLYEGEELPVPYEYAELDTYAGSICDGLDGGYLRIKNGMMKSTLEQKITKK